MDKFIQADIFFFVTAIAVILITAGIIVVLVYAIRILRDVQYVADKAKKESYKIINDVETLREEIKNEGFKVKSFLGILFNYFKKKKSRITKNKKQNGQ